MIHGYYLLHLWIVFLLCENKHLILILPGTQLNSAGDITITIENQDQLLHLHNSYLLVEGDVLKADNA